MAKKMKDEVINLIEKEIRPALQMDQGDVEVVDVDENKGLVTVKLKGHCAGCPMAQMTVTNFIEKRLKDKVKGIKNVIATR